MWNLLSMPEEFQVNKQLTVADYLCKANLTQIEREELSKLVSDIELKYDFHFPDKSELIVIDVSLNYKRDKWTYKSVARTVAHSIPYSCIIYVHDDSIGTVSAFERKENSKDSRRSVISKQSVIPEFNLNGITSETLKCLKDLFESITFADSSYSAVEKSISKIEEYKKYNELFGEYFEELKKEKKKIAKLLQEGLDDVNQMAFGKSSSQNDDNSIVMNFSEEALCKCSYNFFCEDDEDSPKEIDDEAFDWLLTYALNCKSVLEEIYNEEPDESFYYNLGVAFSEQNDSCIAEFEDDPAVQLMREMICEGDEF